VPDSVTLFRVEKRVARNSVQIPQKQATLYRIFDAKDETHLPHRPNDEQPDGNGEIDVGTDIENGDILRWATSAHTTLKCNTISALTDTPKKRVKITVNDYNRDKCVTGN
jgi:hypothetical protein